MFFCHIKSTEYCRINNGQFLIQAGIGRAGGSLSSSDYGGTGFMAIKVAGMLVYALILSDSDGVPIWL